MFLHSLFDFFNPSKLVEEGHGPAGRTQADYRYSTGIVKYRYRYSNRFMTQCLVKRHRQAVVDLQRLAIRIGTIHIVSQSPGRLCEDGI
jgi:hypothetical protein